MSSFNKFYRPALAVIENTAIKEANKSASESLGSLHMLLGLLDFPGGVAKEAMSRISLNPNSLREKALEVIAQKVPSKVVMDASGLPMDEDLVAVLEKAKGFAQKNSSVNQVAAIGTEDLLLAMLETPSQAGKVLLGQIQNVAEFQEAVEEVLHGLKPTLHTLKRSDEKIPDFGLKD